MFAAVTAAAALWSRPAPAQPVFSVERVQQYYGCASFGDCYRFAFERAAGGAPSIPTSISYFAGLSLLPGVASEETILVDFSGLPVLMETNFFPVTLGSGPYGGGALVGGLSDIEPNGLALALAPSPATFELRVVRGPFTFPGGGPVETVTLSAIPEPSTVALVAGGLLALGGMARRQRARARRRG